MKVKGNGLMFPYIPKNELHTLKILSVLGEETYLVWQKLTSEMYVLFCSLVGETLAVLESQAKRLQIWTKWQKKE